MRTAGDIANFALNRIGRGTIAASYLSPGHDIWDDLNAAGRQLFTAHDWPWRMSAPVDIPVVANQGYIELPADYANVSEAWIPNSGALVTLEPISLAEYARLSSLAFAAPVLTRLCVYWPAWVETNAEDEPAPRALLFPTPTANGQTTIRLIYQRRWREIETGDDKAVPNIPRDGVLALAYLTSAIAAQREKNEDNGDGTLANGEIERLIAEVQRTPRKYGFMVGGAASRPSMYPTQSQFRDRQDVIATL